VKYHRVPIVGREVRKTTYFLLNSDQQSGIRRGGVISTFLIASPSYMLGGRMRRLVDTFEKTVCRKKEEKLREMFSLILSFRLRSQL